MTVDPFVDRLARVRHRFVSTLEGKIDAAGAALRNLPVGAPTGISAVAESYRCMHGIVGIGRTVGFPATGRAARDVEDVLRSPYQSGRALTAAEAATFANALQALRDAAARELRSFRSVGEG